MFRIIQDSKQQEGRIALEYDQGGEPGIVLHFPPAMQYTTHEALSGLIKELLLADALLQNAVKLKDQ